MSELKPCPFCGKVPEVVRKDVEPQGDPWYGKRIERFVLCDCGACLFEDYFHEGFESEEHAAISWNRRAPDPDLLAMLREAREALLWQDEIEREPVAARIDAALKEMEG